MTRAYDEIVDFIAAGTTPDSVVRFEPSAATKEYVADLIRREKTAGLTSEEKSELDHLMQIEHLMRLAKARPDVLFAMTSYVSANLRRLVTTRASGFPEFPTIN